jgi:hypothetical protein
VLLVRTDVSEELIASIIRVTRIGELGTTLAVTSILFLRSVLRLLITANVPSLPILVILIIEAIRSSETTSTTRRKISEKGILQISLTFTGLNGVTSWKIDLFMHTAGKTSNPEQVDVVVPTLD